MAALDLNPNPHRFLTRTPPRPLCGVTNTAALKGAETMLGAEFEEIAGVWDPCGFSTNADAKALHRYRCAEIKHGRVAQLAVVGMVMGDVFQLPGALTLGGLKFADVPAGLGALQAVPPLGWAQILLLAGLLETGPFKQDPNKAPGDVASFSWWVRYDDAPTKDRKLKAELKNGRLAMLAVSGMVAQQLVTGQTLVQQVQAGNLNPFPHLDAGSMMAFPH